MKHLPARLRLAVDTDAAVVEIDDDGPGLPEGELERVFRRARAFPLAAPFLLLVGFGAGEVAKRSLTLPDAAIAESSITAMPRVRLEALSNQLHSMHDDGAKTVEYVKMYREHIQPVELVLQRRGVPSSIARQISWPLVAVVIPRAMGLSP